MRISWTKTIAMAGLAGTLVAAAPGVARACGCFTPPDVAVPIVQAGERIVFAVEGDEVVAHIQIQYAGDAREFGWIVPLPSVPKLELGIDELFTEATNRTQPRYRLTTQRESSCNFRGQFPTAAGSESDSGGGNATGKDPSPLVIQDSIGPYDYAVLKADSKDAMLKWLADNRYFVPAGTDEAVVPYIRPGAYFLALKLRSGKSSGDLQPVVVRYKSDLPMIPIVLTSVAAQPHMGIQVFMLGKGRAIPRNYFHTLINDALIDWRAQGQNYNDVIIKAVGEAEGKHSFVTEFAGASQVMRDVLDAPGRFGLKAELVELQGSPDDFLGYLAQHNFPYVNPLMAILQRAFPMPAKLVADKVPAADFYRNFSLWRTRRPDAFVGVEYKYDAKALGDEIWMRVVEPTLATGRLFRDHRYLTRLYTTLSPEDMNRDPVFSYNPDLGDVPNIHQATLSVDCDGQPVELRTADGFSVPYDNKGQPLGLTKLPGSLRIEMLRESGQPEIVTDNRSRIANALDDAAGCSVGGSVAGARGGASLAALGLLGVALAGLVARRRRAGSGGRTGRAGGSR